MLETNPTQCAISFGAWFVSFFLGIFSFPVQRMLTAAMSFYFACGGFFDLFMSGVAREFHQMTVTHLRMNGTRNLKLETH